MLRGWRFVGSGRFDRDFLIRFVIQELIREEAIHFFVVTMVVHPRVHLELVILTLEMDDGDVE